MDQSDQLFLKWRPKVVSAATPILATRDDKWPLVRRDSLCENDLPVMCGEVLISEMKLDLSFEEDQERFWHSYVEIKGRGVLVVGVTKTESWHRGPFTDEVQGFMMAPGCRLQLFGPGPIPKSENSSNLDTQNQNKKNIVWEWVAKGREGCCVRTLKDKVEIADRNNTILWDAYEDIAAEWLHGTCATMVEVGGQAVVVGSKPFTPTPTGYALYDECVRNVLFATNRTINLFSNYDAKKYCCVEKIATNTSKKVDFDYVLKAMDSTRENLWSALEASAIIKEKKEDTQRVLVYAKYRAVLQKAKKRGAEKDSEQGQVGRALGTLYFVWSMAVLMYVC